MTYRLEPEMMYMMPIHFGPGMGPRQGPNRRTFECKDSPKTTSVSVSFLTNGDQLETLLPEGFELGAEPVVTVYASYMKEIEWLAGRGYNVLGVTFPVEFYGTLDQAKGNFLTVLWENLTDPILTGREQLGFSKIYCELPDPLTFEGDTHCTAGWLGFKFLDMHVTNMTQVHEPPDVAPPAPPSAGGVPSGTLHYKYMPRTGEWGTADTAYAVLTPDYTPNRRVLESRQGEGSVQWHRARWEDLPTQYHIINALHDLEILEYRGATITKTIGGKDLSDQRILR